MAAVRIELRELNAFIIIADARVSVGPTGIGERCHIDNIAADRPEAASTLVDCCMQ